MAEKYLSSLRPDLQQFILSNVEETGQELGVGSFGRVVKLKYGGSLCAGKRMHQTLIDPGVEGSDRMSSLFLDECKLMSEMRHPHIAQFLGVCILPSSPRSPLLVTELLICSLDKFLEKESNLPLPLKISILTDVSRGLVHLHSRTPPIIHRDLTARNVLLDGSNKAKITDFGNSRLVDPKHLAKTMTRVPGTLHYMPPEALEANSKYSDKLDMFSFGHLALYTIIQEWPECLLGPTTTDPNTGVLIARSEVERREKYMKILYDMLTKSHFLVQLVHRCLKNVPIKRPSAIEALHWLEHTDALENPDGCEDDAYEMSGEVGEGQVKRGREKAIEQIRDQIDNRTSVFIEEPPETSGDNMTAPLEKLSKGRKPKWKLYTFKIVDGTRLKYFKSGVKKPRGDIALSGVTDVLTVGSGGDKFCFQIHFNGRDSPWQLSAYNEKDRRSWMDAVGKHQQPRMKACFAYGMLPLDPDVVQVDTQEDMHLYDEVPSKASTQGNPPQQLPVNEQEEEDCYEYIPWPLNDISAMPQVSQTTKSPNGNVPTHKKLPASPNADEDLVYAEAAAVLGRTTCLLSKSQIQELVTMLQSTKSGESNQPTSQEEEIYEEAVAPPTLPPIPPSTAPPKPPLTPTRKLPSTPPPKPPSTTPPKPPLPPHPPLVKDDIIDIYPDIDEDTYAEVLDLPKGSHKDPNIYDTLPSLPRPSTPRKKPPPPPKPALGRKGLALPQSCQSATKTLKKVLKETTTFDNESLLTTDDDPQDMYTHRPQWAKANTLYSRLDTLDAMYERTLYIPPSMLTNITDLGEGQFGKVYKALLRNEESQTVQVAVKRVENISSDFQKEISIMREITHPNIVRLYGLMNEGPWAPAMIMEYLPNGDLKNFLTDNERENSMLTKYMIDVAMGMHYLSEKGIIHRDLAARNILVDKNEMCKVSDFGLVREVPKETQIYVSQKRGPSPLRWMPPESITDRVFSYASDVWSFGILLWEIYNPTKIPYPNMMNEEMIVKVASGYRMPTPRNRPAIVIKIMKACWSKEPAKRPSFLLISKLLTKQILGDN